ncbi:conserved hypothetical protein [Gluconacetobacter diazotrophicus PA1 5]|uniref:hypothetical protein n=1 Tax=Gluconacetobacter diazotrophicus TaxID=33996 RepID=UPI000173CE6C|nr:hypothetical protein [Gluconacetobacter diazotrophicus]ACI51276.1 conserved hypothetical protein [Gluconacetobacter diazotrophicus PA1 5]TWB09824.1 hypothetical protein FBZ86_103106 [Gluconacetobacter diazotrophicus]
MKYISLLPLAALLALTACEVPSPEQRRLLNSMVGRGEVDVIRTFGVPTRSYEAQGHTFLAYIDNQTNYAPGGAGWGWGWGGGPGWGGGWGGPGWGGWGGWGGGWGGGGWGGGGWGGTYYTSSCQTTFEIVAGRVSAWTMRGDGC